MSTSGVQWLEFVSDEELARKEPLALAAIQREFPEITHLRLRRVEDGRLSHEFGPSGDTTREQRARIYRIIIDVVEGGETE